jgi:hypothetical protein
MATDWAALQVEYVHGTMTMRDLADTHKIKAAGVMRRGANEKWDTKRKQESARVIKVSGDKLGEYRVDELVEFNETDLKIAKAMKHQISVHISTAQKSNMAMSPTDIRTLMSAHESAQRVGRLALGVSTENSQVTGLHGKDLIPDPIDSIKAELAALYGKGKAIKRK